MLRAQLDTTTVISRRVRSAGVPACEFGRRPAARINPKLESSQRDAAETRSRDGCATVVV